jgi:hypothetical protein
MSYLPEIIQVNNGYRQDVSVDGYGCSAKKKAAPEGRLKWRGVTYRRV